MKKTIFKLFVLCLTAFCINSGLLHSQGFDWQQGGRMPYEIPNLFIGFAANYSNLNHYGDFNLREDLIECCNFGNGDGSSFQAGLTGEYWLDAETALNGSLSYLSNKGIFNLSSTLPTRDGEFITNYEFNSTISYLNLEFGGSKRILGSHLIFGAGLQFSVLLNSKSLYTEQAVSDNVPFEKRTLGNGSIEDLNPFLIIPKLSIGYDYSLRNGYYAVPSISLSYNLNSIIQNDSWRSLSVSFGIKILRAIDN